jgi:sec-independent protein translocase protein TatC
MPDAEKSLLEHLEDLRVVLIRSLVALALLLPAAFYLAGVLLPRLPGLLSLYGGEGIKFHYFSPLEPFIVQLKLSLVFALAGALPYIAFQLSRFIAPALYRKEKKLVALTAGAMTLLFLFGAAFAFFLIVPLVLRFAQGYASAELVPMIGLANFVGLAAILLLGFGLMFQLPVVVLLLVKIGLVSVATLRRMRPVIIIVILALSAILTPPDVLSQLLMAIPTWLLFELSLFVAGRGVPAEPSAADAASAAGADAAADVPPADDDHDPYLRARKRPRRVRPIKGNRT